ncbi:1,4-alpha-glucan branching protein GlgB [Pontibacter silvestris]|uniref:1,4-alpha-glucan branching enzyme GlgB n=1 Tax=Pontibacter silvestris TaxID=2305183 RepID=A0ABW4WV59_9BACT|nr:1,4-alpha-glucan branching protein GlgB [Pontibacter silvestris]
MAKKKESTANNNEETPKAMAKTTKAKGSAKSAAKEETAPEATLGGASTEEAAPKKATGRTRKKATETSEAASVQSSDEAAATKPKRGRAKKTEEASPVAESEATPAPKRGRSRKTVAPMDESTPDPETVSSPISAPVADESENPATGKRTEEQPQESTAETTYTEQVEALETVPAIESGSEGDKQQMVYYNISRFTEFDIYLFREGRHFNLYDKFGSHLMEHEGQQGAYFAVWAPNAEQVSVMGDFNGWNRETHQLQVRSDESGIWEGFIPGVQAGMLYKYHIRSRFNFFHVEKSDPFSFSREVPPQTASVVCDLNYGWQDSTWLNQRKELNGQPQPYSVYELHAGSWRRKPEEDNRPLTYRELAEELPQYVRDLGFTHVEFMPVMHHPFGGSWGYQITGYFAAGSNLGSPQDLMYLVEALHQHGVGVILDWVPSHFPSDENGLVYFDGTHLYEHADPRKGYHPDWNSYIFNYGRNEVRSFLISNALFWLDKYHVDGLRVDAVASMLYLDYSRKEGEWIPNEYGGRENLEAITFIKDFNYAVHERFPDVQTIAEESTAWPGVTAPVDQGGLGFDMKWMMGWMHDTLDYFSKDPVYRKHHQGEITFSMVYAFSERFMLPLSHDEVVYGKHSLIYKMPGDEWQRFANLRTLYGYMFAHPGAKLLFMGAEIAQTSEWNHDSSLEWHLLQYGFHSGMQELIRDLNMCYRQEQSMYTYSFDDRGFEWGDFQDAHNSVMSFLRKGSDPEEVMLVVCNFTPMMHHHYRLGVPMAGKWVEVINTDLAKYGGSDVYNLEPPVSVPEPLHGRDYSIELRLPPLSVVWLKYQRNSDMPFEAGLE